MRSIASDLKKKAYAELKAMQESERQAAMQEFEHAWPSKILDYIRTSATKHNRTSRSRPIAGGQISSRGS
jgi:hypothetical protein